MGIISKIRNRINKKKSSSNTSSSASSSTPQSNVPLPPPTPTPTSSGSSGGVFNVIKGNYDIKTKTYTSPEGYKQSMNVGEALKVGAKFVGSSSSSGGYSYVDTSTGIGYEVSPSGVRKEIKPSGVRKEIKPISSLGRYSQAQQKLVSAGLTTEQAKVVVRREELKREAERRGRPFTRVGTEKFLGGGRAIKSLREARQRGASSKVVRQVMSPELQEVETQQRQSSAQKLLFGGGIVEQPPIIPVEEGGNLYQQPVYQTQPFFQRVKTKGQEKLKGYREYEKTLLYPQVEGQAHPEISSYGSAFFQELVRVPGSQGFSLNQRARIERISSLPKLGRIIKGTKAYEKAQRFNEPRIKAVVSSNEFKLLSTGAMFTPAGKGQQIFKVVKPLRQRKPTYATEYISSELRNGKLLRTSDYTIYTEKKPPRIQYIQKYAETPKDFKYLPEIKSVIRTPYGATSEDAFITLETKGGNVARISEITGTSKQITRQEILNYEKLVYPRKYLVEQLAKSKTGGTAVSPEMISKIITEKNQQFFSKTDVKALGKARITPKGFQLETLPIRRLGSKRYKVRQGAVIYRQPYKESYYSYPFGKTTKSYEVITERKLIKETDLYDFSTSKILYADVTKPYAKPRGKASELKVLTIEEKIPRVIEDFKDVNVIKPADIKKTLLSQKYKQINKPITIPPPPKVPKAISRTQTISPVINRAELFKPSSYIGTGLYERTEGGLTPSIKPSQSSYQYSPLTQDYISNVLEKEKLTFKPLLNTGQRSVSKEITKEINKEMLKEVPVNKEITKEITKLSQKPIQKLMLKQYQKPILKFKFYGSPRPPVPVPPPRTPIIVPPKLKPYKPPRQRGVSYIVSVRRYGKFKPVGIGSFKDVFNFGRYTTQYGLGQSFKIESRGGGKVPSLIPKGYYSKYEKGQPIYIEKPKSKINTSIEKFLLAQARRNKSPYKRKRKSKKIKGDRNTSL